MNEPTSSTRSALPGLLLRVSGNWAHFKKPETNNNPLTHDFITKTALLGLMGAVLGIERREMRPLFPQWSDDLVYGVQVRGVVKKESWAFTMRGVVNQNDKAPKPMELLKNPDFTVALASRHERSDQHLQDFATCLRESRAHYTPVLGLHNCAANLDFLDGGNFQTHNGEYSTKGFALREHGFPLNANTDELRLRIDNIPSHQNDDFWNNPKDYKEVFYADGGREIMLPGGEHFRFDNGDAWCLV